MNSFNSETLRASAMKFVDNLSYYCRLIKLIIKLAYDRFLLRKSEINELQASF